ncbi:MAG: response regulator [Lachnospiraceae bacterium]|nr:response regulator [Lachnospiraceae bacterium]
MDKRCIRLVVCDDDELYIQQIRQIAEMYFQENEKVYECMSYVSGEDLLQDCLNGKLGEVDLLILDIEMGDIDGITVKNVLEEKRNVKRILFVTNHAEVMQEAFGFNVVGFLNKPVKQAELKMWLQKVSDGLEKETRIHYKNGRREEIIYAEDVQYIQGNGEYTILYTKDLKKGQLVTQSMKAWEQGVAHTSIVRIISLIL